VKFAQNFPVGSVLHRGTQRSLLTAVNCRQLTVRRRLMSVYGVSVSSSLSSVAKLRHDARTEKHTYIMISIK